MDTSVNFKQNIEPLWNAVNKVREEVGTLMADQEEEIRSASQMVVSELVENAVKYGIAIDQEGERGIEVEVAVNDAITITVVNRAISEEELADARLHIDRINQVADPKTLYLQRIGELMEGHGQEKSCQLGLFRIAYEGGFDLSYEVEGAIITVRAHRALGKP